MISWAEKWLISNNYISDAFVSVFKTCLELTTASNYWRIGVGVSEDAVNTAEEIKSIKSM